MIGTIRKHSKILWVVIIAVVVVTFVFWQSQPSNRGSQRDVNLGSIGGEPIAVEDYLSAKREVTLLYYFSYNEWPGDSAKRAGFDVERETYFRLLMLRKIKQENIHVADETVAKMAAELLRAFNRGNPASLPAFEQNILRPQRLTALDFERYLRHYLGIQQLMAANGMSGRLVTPQEARILYEREHEEIVTEAVFFAATNYESGLTVTPEAVNQFWTNQMSRYRLPERVQVSYVAFDVSNLLARAEAELVKTNFNELIEATFQQVGTNYYREAKTPDEVRAKIREDLIHRDALFLARKQANEFAGAADALTNKAVADFERLAGERKLAVKVTEPFDREDGPKEFVVGADFLKEAFLRTAEEPIYGPLVGRDAAYVIALKARLPSEIPALETIRDRVTADYRHAQAVLAARAAGEGFVRTLTNGIAAGKKFSSLCVEAGVKPVTLPPLSLSSRSVPVIEDHASLNSFKSAAFTAPSGQASGLVATPEGGFVVFVRERLPIEMAKLTAELPDFMYRVRQARQGEAYNDWFRREADRYLRDTPLFHPQPPQLGQPAGPAKKK
jgi:hypothetical protein